MGEGVVCVVLVILCDGVGVGVFVVGGDCR